MLRIVMSCAVAGLLAACAGSSSELGDDKPKQMSDEQMMQKAMQLATPGPEHKRLQPMVGTFGATARWVMDPSKPEEVSQGTSTNDWIFDGRFLQTKYEGTTHGQPFHGLGLVGYDNAAKHYQSIWLDSMGTMMMPIFNGTSDANGKVITFRGEFDCPIRSQHFNVRQVWTIVDNNRHTMEWYEKGEDGNERRAGVIEFVRAR
jgi:hypothetical protein